MPVYDYKCAEHGLFYGLASVDDHDKPAQCPQCQAMSPRVIMISPEVLAMAKEKKQAMDRNEQARHEPTHSTQQSRAELKAENADRQKRGCGCRHQGSASEEENKRSSKLMYTADGSKMFPSMRPWMISH